MTPKTLQTPNPLYIKMFWKSKIVPEFFLKKQHLKRYTPLVFVFCTLEHFLKHGSRDHLNTIVVGYCQITQFL